MILSGLQTKSNHFILFYFTLESDMLQWFLSTVHIHGNSDETSPLNTENKNCTGWCLQMSHLLSLLIFYCSIWKWNKLIVTLHCCSHFSWKTWNQCNNYPSKFFFQYIYGWLWYFRWFTSSQLSNDFKRFPHFVHQVFFSFYWAYKSSTIDGLEVRVSVWYYC